MLFKKITTIIILSTSLFASFDLAELYLTNGIKSVENELIKQFQNKQFWDEYLKNKDVSTGYYETIKYSLTCKPDLKNIVVHKHEKHEKIKVFESEVLTGKVNGAKSVDGDLKTPIGAYQLIDKITPPDQFYGPLALITNYPNNLDKINNKTGDGIWIHGLPFTGNRDPYTKGCIAIENENLKKLDKKINFEESILIIGDIDQTKVNKHSIAKILAELYTWKHTWQNGDFDKYLSYYSKKFKKLDGSDFVKFSSYKKSIFSKNEEKNIQIKDINIIPYPNTENKTMFKIEFFQAYTTKTYRSAAKKELYVELNDGKMEILFES